MSLYLPTGEKFHSKVPDYIGSTFIIKGSDVGVGDDCVINMMPLLDFNIQTFVVNNVFFYWKKDDSKAYPKIYIQVHRQISRDKDIPIVFCPLYLEDNIESTTAHLDSFWLSRTNINLPLLFSTDKIIIKPTVQLSYFELQGQFSSPVHIIDLQE